jgi:hypothetical protein
LKFNDCQSKDNPHPEEKKLIQELPSAVVRISPTEAEVATQFADEVVVVVAVADVVEGFEADTRLYM